MAWLSALHPVEGFYSTLKSTKRSRKSTRSSVCSGRQKQQKPLHLLVLVVLTKYLVLCQCRNRVHNGRTVENLLKTLNFWVNPFT